jgi:alkaline phosphatase D
VFEFWTCVLVLNQLVFWFCISGQPNFGAIEIDWDTVPPRIKLELRDVQGHFVDRVKFPISELQPSDALASKKQVHGIQRHCTLETELPWLTRYRLALLFFVTIAGMLTCSNMNILAIEIYVRISSNIQQYPIL